MIIKQDKLPGQKILIVFRVLLILVFVIQMEVLYYSSGKFSLFVLTHLSISISFITLFYVLGMPKTLPNTAEEATILS